MYAGENNEKLAINSDRSLPYQGTPSWVSTMAVYPAGYMMDWSTKELNTNINYVTGDNYSLLGSLCGKAFKVFACPSANFVSPVQQSAGWSARARSVVMNGGVGNGSKTSGLMGPNPVGVFAKKTSDFITPGPSDTWVFMDEHPDSIDDGMLYVYVDNNTLSTGSGNYTELPGSMHGGGCGVTFADGHSEIHKWRGSLALANVTFTYQGFKTVSNDPDLAWLAQHTPH